MYQRLLTNKKLLEAARKGQNECVCKTGYMGNGIECDLINPCLEKNGGCHDLAKCELSTGGTHTCTCPEGYAGDGTLCYGTLPDRYGDLTEDLSGNLTLLIPILAPSLSDLPPEPPTLMEFLNSSSNFTLFRQYALMYNLSQKLHSCCQQFTLLLPTDDAIRQHLSATNSSLMESDVFKYHVVIHFLLFPHHLSDGILKSTMLGNEYQVQFHLDKNNQTVVNDVPLDGTFTETQFGLILVLPQVLKVRRNRCSKQGRCTDCEGPPQCPFFKKPIKEQFPVNMRPNCRYRKRFGSRRKSVRGCVIKCIRESMDLSCCPGYYGHECFKCPGDVGSRCSNHGECQDGNLGNGECRCFEGFHGTACEDCEPGRYGNVCVTMGSVRTVWQEVEGVCVIKDGKELPALQRSRMMPAEECVTRTPRPQGTAAACVCVAGYEGNGTYCKGKDTHTHTHTHTHTTHTHTHTHTHTTHTHTHTHHTHTHTHTHTHILYKYLMYLLTLCLSELELCSRSNGGCSEFASCKKASAGERTCSCKEGYTGDGVICLEIDGCLVNNGGCLKSAECTRTGPNITACNCKMGFQGSGKFCYPNNGGCSRYARCEYFSQGQRNCSCLRSHVGDGFDCRGTTNTELSRQSENDFFRRMLSLSGVRGLYGDGPFTVFAPAEKTNHESSFEEWNQFGRLPDLVRYHVVSCETLTLSDLKTTKLASDYTTSNGVIHHIDTMLTPYKLQDKPRIQYTKDAGLLPVLEMSVHQPYTMFWPTDDALNSLSAERQHWLSSPEHQDQVAALVKAHIIRNSRGAVWINGNAARVVERYLDFKEGLAYGIDQLLEPPGLGALCDSLNNRTTFGKRERCTNMRTSRFRSQPWFTLDDPFSRMGCKRVCQVSSWVQKCCKNHYSRDCQVCPGGLEAPCGNHGDCDDGMSGSGRCNCHEGFIGKACELCAVGHYGPNCTACSCGQQGRCDTGIQGSGQCVCKPGWKGEHCEIDIAPDLCAEYNGGCHQNADCNQTGLIVNCTCTSGYQGDGYSCEPINRCIEENGGCSDFASCKFTGPNERQCECLPGYVGNGVQCLDKLVSPVDRCLEDNGDCDPVATCKDLHYHANTAGVFHLRSPDGKYKMNFSQADAACRAEGAVLASFKKLGDAQQLSFSSSLTVGMHLCVAGWMEGGEVGYPTRFPSVKCGDNHVGLVIYKEPVDQSSMYDAYCFRLKDVSCVCPADYIGNGDFCNGVLTSVLASYSNFSIFYKLLLDYSGSSTEGKQLVDFMSHRKSEVTLFVPHNAGFAPNQVMYPSIIIIIITITKCISNTNIRDLEYHISANHSRRPFKDLKHQEVIVSRLGFNLNVTYGKNESFKLVNKRLLVGWDIPAVNGIIHIIESPLTAPPAPISDRASSRGHTHSSGTVSAILVSLSLLCVLAGLGYYVFKHKTDAFRFHYFRNEDEDGAAGGRMKPALVSIANPLYSGSRAFSEPFGDAGPSEPAQLMSLHRFWTCPHKRCPNGQAELEGSGSGTGDTAAPWWSISAVFFSDCETQCSPNDEPAEHHGTSYCDEAAFVRQMDHSQMDDLVGRNRQLRSIICHAVDLSVFLALSPSLVSRSVENTNSYQLCICPDRHDAKVLKESSWPGKLAAMSQL
ncbi:hypothetical protein F7725_017455 [Dissostichus mawsoni]|uniref:Stabilin 1 n=1 Tax=Dissostichus mawsoni TaxID=36200 RepID=A0A7J5Z4G8_DISMA|nr:hypothetical protein F7725_017455 [Dissostichus mawsoni]